MALDQFRDVDVVLDKVNDNIIQGQFVSEGDYNGRTMTVMVTDGGVVGPIPGLQASLLWNNQANKLTDEHPFQLIDSEKSIFRIEFPNNMLTAGTVVANIRIWLGGKVMTTKPFKISVGAIAGRMSGVIQQQEFGLLTAVLADANSFRTNIDSKAEKKDVASLFAHKADKSELIPKADRSWVEATFATTQSQFTSTYTTLLALQTAFPSGASGTYLVLDNNGLYEWSNSEWTYVKDYEIGEVELKNGIVSPKKTSFMELDTTKNMFDGVYERKYLQGGSGSLSISNNAKGKFKTFPVKPSTTYRLRLNVVVLLKYGTSVNLLSGGALDGRVSVSMTGNSTTIITGPNDNWLYISLTNPSTDNYSDDEIFLKILETTSPVAIEPGEGYPFTISKNIGLTKLTEPENTTFFEKENLNLFDGVWLNYYLRDNAPNLALYNQSGYASFMTNIEPNTIYSILKAPTEIEDGFFYFKIATSKLTVEQLVNQPQNYKMDGFYQRSIGDNDTTHAEFTSGPEDRSVVISVAKSQRPYTELLKGRHNQMVYNRYGDHFKPKNIEVYSKREVNQLIEGITTATSQRGIYVKKEFESNMMIYVPQASGNYIGYRYERYARSSLNLYVWRATDIYLCDSNFNHIHSITTGDNEGVLRITGEDDFVGGWHGDELGTQSLMFLNGCQVPITSTFEGWFDSVEFLIASDVFHADDSTLAFKKIKNVIYDVTGVHIVNKWIAQNDFHIQHVRGTMLSIMKKSGEVNLIHSFNDNVNLIPALVPEGTGGSMPSNSSIDKVKFYGGLVSAEIWAIKRDSENINGSITNFGERLKVYIDSYVNENVVAGQEIYDEHKYIIRSL